ncbi:NlpC/P60 family peptidoglycan endopeptidase RipB [Mycolicibacterium iranicum]|uniref:Peptidase C40 n=1 Tax=Mycolicibacterium iranicum TaxID=912594 RepID=A0A178LE19_MYCIR|nr:NlpC/P60 family peptidoglycan endopeptidase RipB [Mycolicibacterium iranicum]OAN28698.1 peptidase C40 [Mycolicibacterium iranicum]
MTLRRFALSVIAAAVVLAGTAAPANAQPSLWDPLLPMRPSAGAPGDPLAIANASLAVTAQATQATMGMGRKFLQSLGLVPPDAPSVAPGSVRGAAAVEHVIKRGAARLGTPYSWGGGKPTGPSLGVERGANTVGFDCSGFTQYSFAGVGVLIPKYSGDQFNTGRRVPIQQAKRGDLLFWGPGGSQHVAIYLGNGQMLESGGTADRVVVSKVRMAGLQPTVQRIIES